MLSSLQNVHTLGPISILCSEYQGALSLGVKWQWHEADHLPPSCAEFMNDWSYTSIPPCASMLCGGTALLQFML